MISRQAEDSKIDNQIALPNIRSYPDAPGAMEEKDEDSSDERVDVVGTTEPHNDSHVGK